MARSHLRGPMSWYKFAAIVCASAATTIANAEAQQAPAGAAPPTVVRDPGDPRAAVPPVEYRSAFSRYRPNVEAEVGSWREKNDEVRRIGGWRVYGREAIVDSNRHRETIGRRQGSTGRHAQAHARASASGCEMTTARLSTDEPARRHLRALAGAAIAVLLAGCASFSEDGRFGPVAEAAKKHTGQEAVWARTAGDLDSIDRRVTELLTQPLTADSAVQVALLNNRGLQATYQELGIAEAELVQASRLPNPGFSFARLKRGSEVEYERTFSFDLGHLIALPFAAEMEGRRIEAIQRGVAMEMLQVASEARKAYYNAIAAEQSVRYMTDVKAAADAGAELARRLAQAGNINKLQQAREHGFYSEAVLNLARAQQMRTAARERLARALGLWGSQLNYTLPDRLPDLPKEPADQPDIEQLAMAQRLDVQAARLQAESTAKHLGLSKATRFINVLEVGYEYNTSNEEPRQTGWEVSVEIPLFDFGSRADRARRGGLHAVGSPRREGRGRRALRGPRVV